MSEELVMMMLNNLNERMQLLSDAVKTSAMSQKILSQRIDLCYEAIDVLKRNVFDEKEES